MIVAFGETYNSLRKEIPPDIRLVAVSKFQPAEVISQFIAETGHKILGENRVQEFLQKKDHLPNDIEWHFIGHLQTNKVGMLVPHVAMIQSVDSYKLLREINREAEKAGRIIPVLLEFHIAQEESKYGFSLDTAMQMLEDGQFCHLKNISIQGVMGMASLVDDHNQIRSEFRMLRKIFDRLKKEYFTTDKAFSEISMGMSGDYMIAIEEGSTIIRIGTLLFGERQ